MIKIKTITLPDFDFVNLTVLAVSCSIGSTTAYGFLHWGFTAVSLLWLIFLSGNKRKIFIFGLLAGLSAGFIHKKLDDHNNSAIPRHDTNISGILFCNDSRITQVKNLPPLKIVNCKFSTDERKFDVAAIFPEGCKIFYADQFHISGRLYPARPAGILLHENDQGNSFLPPLYGDRPLLIVDNIHSRKSCKAFLLPFLRLREILLKQLLSGIDDEVIS